MIGACLALNAGSLALAQSDRVILTPSPGFSITWDGNNGEFSSPDAGAGPSNNVALASQGTIPFTSSDLGPVLGLTYHLATNLNDGLYGNNHSWISANGVGGTDDPDPFAGLSFPSLINITNIAWGRDNGDAVGDACGGTCVDRTIGIYTLQYTLVEGPDMTTPETDDAATGWATIGTVEYLPGTESPSFTSYLRHRFELSENGNAIEATGLRIKVSDGGMDIDEIEVNPIPNPIPPITNFVEIQPASGFSIDWDGNEGNFSTDASPALAPLNDASAANGATAFGSSEANLGVHFISNVNDGLYGNTHSWIPDFVNGDPAPFIGINFGRCIQIGNIAWSRDNGDATETACGGTCMDRALGLYTIQITSVTDADASTPETGDSLSGWVTIGTINYKQDDPTYFNSYLRHRFDVAAAAGPVLATAIRIKVPNSSSDIDEIEVNVNQAVEQQAVVITAEPGLTLTWDGNDGDFNDPAVGAAPPDNRALASAGSTPFGSSELGPILSIPFHRFINLNDGLYGNSHSWISANGLGGTDDPDPFVGISFNGTVGITNIAWSRDNGDAGEGTFTDRVLDTYTLQYTLVDAPDANTVDTGDASTGWAPLGTVTYTKATPPFFTPYLRHRFDVAEGGGALNATAIRIKVANGLTDLDEVEVNTGVTPPPPVEPPLPIVITSAPGYEISFDGNDGQFYNPAAGAAPPPNRALASEGTVAFGSSQVDLGVHFVANVIDGLYGNTHSWIPDFINGDPAPFIGLNFGASVDVSNIAWSRDNGDTTETACGGTCMDRALGLYTLQVTQVDGPDANTPETEDPSTGWITVGTIDYQGALPDRFTPYLRHRFDLSQGGGSIAATGVRLKVPDQTSDIDEIEVNTATEAPTPELTIVRSGDEVVISWIGGGALQAAPTVTGPWTDCFNGAANPYHLSLTAAQKRFFRVLR